MAPDSKILKRKRSRAAEWWTVGQNISNPAVKTDKPAEKIPSGTIEANKRIPPKYQNPRFTLRSNSIQNRIISNVDHTSKATTRISNDSERTNAHRKASDAISISKGSLSSNYNLCPRSHLATSKVRQQDHVLNVKKNHDDELSISSQSRNRLRRNNNVRIYQETSSVEIEAASSSLAKACTGRKPSATSYHDLDPISSRTFDPSKASIEKSRSVRNTSSNIGSQNNLKIRYAETDEQEDLSSDHELCVNFSHPKLMATIKSVPRLTIESRWSTLSSDCVENISFLLKDIQLPVIVSFNSRRKKIIVSKSLKLISDKIVKKTSNGILFPLRPGKKRDEDFDFKKTSNRCRYLEDTLTPAIHANELLRLALDKEVEYLRIERQRLSNIETNSKKEITHRNQNFRKLHPVIRSEYKNEIYDFEEDIGLESAMKTNTRSISSNGKTDQLANLIGQIHNHVNSLLINIEQVDGIGEKITEAKANLQSSLFNTIGGKEYDYIVMGIEQ